MSLQPIHWIMGLYCTLTYQQSLGEENSASDSRDGPRVEKTVKTTRRFSSRIGETLSTITHTTKGSKGQQFEINRSGMLARGLNRIWRLHFDQGQPQTAPIDQCVLRMDTSCSAANRGMNILYTVHDQFVHTSVYIIQDCYGNPWVALVQLSTNGGVR